MDWVSFIFGFFAFPLLGIVSFGVAALAKKLLDRRADLSNLSHEHRGSTLSFSSRLIGEIGERFDSDAGPTAKAS